MITAWSTLSRSKEPLEPIEPGRMRLFVCGPTVYDWSHLGHAKTYTQFDLIARYLRFRGFALDYVQNITDIDDKIIARATERGVGWEELAREFEERYMEDMAALGNTSVDRFARATDFIDAIVSQIRRLLDGGHAYELDDGIYFHVPSFPEYGKLARRTEVAAEDALTRIDENPDKRDPRDFALWKRPKEGEPTWETEIGPGRPGWHVEDTAITEALLGEQYEIHGGAVDLIFPHHEAEIAVMESISGKAPLAKYWLHTGFLTVPAEKTEDGEDERMGKSLGNFTTIRQALEIADARVLRFFLLSRHYRERMAYEPELLDGAAASLKRIENFWVRLPASEPDADDPAAVAARERMLAALDDDFNAPAALATLYEFIGEQHRADTPAAGSRRLLEDFDAIFAVLPRQEVAAGESDEWIDEQIERRRQLRAERKFAEADAIRHDLAARNIVLEDTADGVHWHRAVATD